MLCIPAFATTPITGTLKDPGTGIVSTGSFIRAWLRGCGSNQPRVAGVGIFPPNSSGPGYYKDFAPNASGVISGTLYSTRDAAGTGNGEIECGGSLTATWYGIQAYYNGRPGIEVPVNAKIGVSFDISNVSPITFSPVVTAPTGDSTYCRLDGGNCGFTGPITIGTVNGTTSFPGTDTFRVSNQVRYASLFAGADCGLQIVAAMADLVAANARGGLVVGDFVGGVCTGFTVATGVTVLLKAGNYGFTSSLLVKPGGHLIGEGTGNAGGTMIHGQGAGPAGDLVQSFDQSGGTYWDSASIENFRIDMSQGGGAGTNAIHIWNMGQASALRNIEITNAKASGIKINGSPVPMALFNISVFASATYGYDIDFGLTAEESGNAFACYTCTGDDNVSGLFRFRNGGDRSTVLIAGSKGERKINVVEQDPIFTLDHFSGQIHIDSFEAFNVTGFPNAVDVIKIVDTITPGTPLSPDIMITEMNVRRYNNIINDTVNSKIFAAPAACTLAAPCIISRVHYPRNANYIYEDINGSTQVFGSSTGSVNNFYRVWGDAFNRMVFRPGSICMGDASADPISPQNCIQSSAGNAGLFVNKNFVGPTFQSNIAAGTAPFFAATRTMGQDPMANMTFVNHPYVVDGAGNPLPNAKIVKGAAAFAGSSPITVTLTGSAVFTNTNYVCTFTNATTPSAPTPKLSITGNNQFTLALSIATSDSYFYMCVGN